MRRGWKTLGFASAFAACSFCANAQTFHWNWTGFYVGADAGFVSSRSLSSTQATISPTPYLLTATPSPGASPFSTFNANAVDTLSARGAEGGVHAGYNWQLKPFAVGLEIDYSGLRANTVRDATFVLFSGAVAPPTTPPTIATIVSQLHSETNTNWLFTVRPRVGWVYSFLYGYITGGAAFTTITATTRYSDAFTLSNATTPVPIPLANGLVSTSQSKVGWTMGAGLEVAIAPRWTLRAEYLRVEFSGITGVGRITNGGVPPAGVGGLATFNPISLGADYKNDIVRVGVSHKFQWWSEEPVPPVAPGPVVVAKD